MIDLHARAKRVGNSWAIIIPKEKADAVGISAEKDLHIEIEVIKKLFGLKGTFKTKKSTGQLMEEIDEGWK
ncbi:hypothetical protein H0O02_04795 [Candidatus Micrarchaeota archaeon]|nr:hypothetical protein [Candidatus Micrarchaeota archaeon]